MNGPVTDAQLDAIWRACSDIATESEVREACRNLATRLTTILGAPAVVFRRDVSPWKVVATSGAATELTPAAAVEHLRRLVPAFEASYHVIRAGDSVWTPLPLDEQVPWQSVLLLSGDWQQGNGAPWLPRLARMASLALRLVASCETARKTGSVATSAYGLARRLGQVSGEDVIHRVIVESAARAASARLAGLSVYRPRDGAISIAATFGYPSESVGHVRIMPGAGIIGGVFASRKPLLVKDTGKVPGLTPRSRRYQTSSFMALPIVAGREALGVVTLADREDGRPFSGTDLSAARMVTAVS